MPTQAAQPEALSVVSLSHAYPAPKKSRREPDRPAGRRLALDGISFTVHPGEIFGILGPNGSGKTTLFRILSTMLAPNGGPDNSGGTASITGHDVLAAPAAARAQFGVVFQSPSLDGKLTAIENLRHHGRLYGLAGKDLKNRINQWLAFFGLTERRSEFVERFSGGMRRKLEVAKALLHEPKLLLMDEPATGLDPAARRELWQKLLQLRQDKNMTIVLTTHLMDEAEHCDRLAIMAAGKLITVDTPDHLKSRIGGDVITLEPEPKEVSSGCHTLSATAAKCADSVDGTSKTDNTLCPPGQSVAPDLTEGSLTSAADRLAADITAKFGPWDDGAAPTVVDGRVRFEKPDGARLAAEAASTFPDRIRSLTVGRPTIEDAFMHLTGVGLGDGDR